MSWWVWVVAGLAVGIIEILAPGYIFLGFAIGAVAVGLLHWAGLMASGLAFQIAAFAVISVLAWLGLSRAFPLQRGQVKRWTRDINE
ncbi:NfeD family protein [Gemmobacter denitrificans]|uniref:NfeD-like partner-binding protein n=1 Tax=Gemmobacter denitrificans TaxID=3123040 RepID=A0ABU8BTV5_9RHOB